jgi:hypothetical protein
MASKTSMEDDRFDLLQVLDGLATKLTPCEETRIQLVRATIATASMQPERREGPSIKEAIFGIMRELAMKQLSPRPE